MHRIAFIALVVMVLVLSPATAQFAAQAEPARSGLVETLQAGEIDWGGEFIQASGEGVMPSVEEESNRAKAYLKAKGYGRMKAIANLLMTIDETRVSCKAIGKDYTAKNETLRQTIEGYVANVEIVGERQQSQAGDTMVVVTVRAPLYGANGIGSAILKNKFQRETSTDSSGAGVNVEKRADIKTATVTADAKGPFSSLIIDCGGLGIERAISPKIRRADGSEVWGTVKVDYDFLLSHGIVAYTTSTEEARRNSRAGANPLILRAVGRAGGRFLCDAVVSNTDAERMTRENQSSRFLDKFDVIFAGP